MSATAQEEFFRTALELIAENHCGIPGHAVAVGCGSSWAAKEALEGRLWKKCAACYGRGWTQDFVQKGKPPTASVTVTTHPCETCDQNGWVRA